MIDAVFGAFEGREEHEVFAEYPHYRDDPNFNGFMNHFQQCAPRGENLATVTARAAVTTRSSSARLPPT